MDRMTHSCDQLINRNNELDRTVKEVEYEKNKLEKGNLSYSSTLE